VLNATRGARKLEVKAAGKHWDLRLGGHSFATLIVEE
jgi:hypothetical protein